LQNQASIQNLDWSWFFDLPFDLASLREHGLFSPTCLPHALMGVEATSPKKLPRVCKNFSATFS
jgi:hypothetical protein